jgi:DNA-binding Lrp family transcriptional regulator
MIRPTALDVLLAMASQPALQYSVYIANEVRRTGVAVSQSKCLRRLRELESLGYVERSTYPLGYYGYKWTVTAAGMTRLGSPLK